MTAKFFGGPGSVWSTPVPADVALDPLSATMVTELTDMVAATPTSNWWMGRWENGTSRVYTVNNSTARQPVYLSEPEGNWIPPVEFGGGHYGWLSWIFRGTVGVPILDSFVASHPADWLMAIYNEDTNEMWDFYNLWKDDIGGAVPAPGGPYGVQTCRWGGYYRDVTTHPGIPALHIGVDGWHSEHWQNGAVASSLPLMGGIILEEELYAGEIPHALSMQVPNGDGYVWPAQRSDLTGGTMSEGTRFRLNPSFDVDSISFPYSAQGLASAKMIATAAQTYGIIVTDRTLGVMIRSEWPQSDIDYFDYGGNLGTLGEGIPDILWAALPLDQLEVVSPDWRPDGFPPAWDLGGDVATSGGWRIGSL